MYMRNYVRALISSSTYEIIGMLFTANDRKCLSILIISHILWCCYSSVLQNLDKDFEKQYVLFVGMCESTHIAQTFRASSSEFRIDMNK